MLLAVATPIIAVLAGTLLAMAYGPRHWLFGPVRAFALAAVVVTVLVHLLPESIEAVGGGALGLFALGLVVPIALGALAGRLAGHGAAGAAGADEAHRHADSAVAVELGYVSLLVHKVGDGIGLGTYTGPLHAGHSHIDIVVAIGAHTIPMAAIVVFAFGSRGRLHALLRAGGLVVATIFGILVTDLGSTSVVAAAAPWFNAAVAGLLMHIVAHDLPETTMRRPLTRAAEVAAVAIGVALPLLGGHGEEGGISAEDAFTAAVRHVGLTAAPFAVAGLAVVAAVVYLRRPGHRTPLAAFDAVVRVASPLLLFALAAAAYVLVLVAPDTTAVAGSPLALASAAALVAAAARSIWLYGVEGWFAALGVRSHAHVVAEHRPHAHAHEHRHEHEPTR